MDGSLRRHPVPVGVAIGVQATLAVALLTTPLYEPPPWSDSLYYGLVIALLPTVVSVATGRLGALQRLVIVLGPTAHIYGVRFDLYGRFPWWDVVTHGISAGLLAAGAYLLLLGLRGQERGHGWRFHAIPFAVVLVGGVAWEVYELYVPWLIVYGTADTARDLVVDMTAWAVVSQTYLQILGGTQIGLARRLRGLGRGSGAEGRDRDAAGTDAAESEQST